MLLSSGKVPPDCVVKGSDWWAMPRAAAAAVLQTSDKTAGGVCTHGRMSPTRWQRHSSRLLLLLLDAGLCTAFGGVRGAHTWYFATCLAMAGLLDASHERDELQSKIKAEKMRKLYGIKPKKSKKRKACDADGTGDGTLRRNVTYCRWPHVGAPHPAVLAVDAAVVAAARRQRALVFRRVAPTPVPVAEWCKAVLDLDAPPDGVHGAVPGPGPTAGSAGFQKRTSRSKFLVVLCAGDGSLHLSCGWHRAARRFDLCVNYFGGDDAVHTRFSGSADHYFRFKGPKWAIVRQLLATEALAAHSYDYVWLPDDDLDISVSDVNTMFDVAAEAGVRLAQPSMANQYVAHDVLVQDPTCLLRYTNFVELMCPLFAVRSSPVIC